MNQDKIHIAQKSPGTFNRVFLCDKSQEKWNSECDIKFDYNLTISNRKYYLLGAHRFATCKECIEKSKIYSLLK